MCFFRYDGSTKEASFSVGLQGIAKEDTQRVKQLISQTVDDIIEYAATVVLTQKFPSDQLDEAHILPALHSFILMFESERVG